MTDVDLLPRPPYRDIPALWSALSAATRDALGCALVVMVFADFVSGENYADHDKLCDVDTRLAASDLRDDMLRQLPERVQAALPELFGNDPSDEHPDGMDPPWAWFDLIEMDEAIRNAGVAVEQALRRKADLARIAAARAQV